MEDLYIMFTGEETEKEFLKKCYEQWGKACEAETETQRLIVLGSLFGEIRHRLEDLEE